MNNKQPTIVPKPQVGKQIRVNLEDLERIQCEHCKGEEFGIVWKIHKVSAILSQTGQESLFPVAYFRCSTCFKTTKIIHKG
jgi:hypothetical protein